MPSDPFSLHNRIGAPETPADAASRETLTNHIKTFDRTIPWLTEEGPRHMMPE